MSNLPAVTDKTFQQEVLDAPAVLVDLWAEWCGGCLMLDPIINEIAAEMAGQVKIVGVDIHDGPETASSLDIRTIPSLIFFRAGKEVHRIIGVPKKDLLVAEIRKHLLT